MGKKWEKYTMQCLIVYFFRRHIMLHVCLFGCLLDVHRRKWEKLQNQELDALTLFTMSRQFTN